jgi:hypothetical protein
MAKFRMALIIAAGVVAALIAGWLYGWSGTRPLHREVTTTRLRLQLTEARMKVLDARVDIYSANFGAASQNLEHAKPPLQAARTMLQDDGRSELAAQLDTALQRTTEAQQLASKFNQDANSRAGEAGRLIADVLQATR